MEWNIYLHLHLIGNFLKNVTFGMIRKNYFKKSMKGVGLLVLTVLLSGCEKMIIFNSKGPIGQKEAQLIIAAFVLMLIVVIPVFVMVILFSWRYRASNKKADYRPDWHDSTKIEWVIWSVPVAIIIVLAVLTWKFTHELDPYRPIKSELPALQVEVISTDWNWIFIYPEENLATINELVIEAGRPVRFKLTSATVMTSFFIPQLGSQIYAMAGMLTQLNLLADEPGKYLGQNIEYSGTGYHTMHFDVYAKTADEFRVWVAQAKQSPESLNMENYNKISGKQIMDYPVTVFSSVEPNLFHEVMAPYMEWMGHIGVSPDEYHHMHTTDTTGHDMQNMNHSGHDMNNHSGHKMHEMKTDTMKMNH